jgi:hypothetical protein
MMTPNDETMRKLEQVLTEVHRARQAPPLGPDWSEGVMRDVRRLAIQKVSKSVGRGIERLVWQTAGLAAAIALILTVSLIAWSSTPASEGVGLAAEEFDPVPLFLE